MHRLVHAGEQVAKFGNIENFLAMAEIYKLQVVALQSTHWHPGTPSIDQQELSDWSWSAQMLSTKRGCTNNAGRLSGYVTAYKSLKQYEI